MDKMFNSCQQMLKNLRDELIEKKNCAECIKAFEFNNLK